MQTTVDETLRRDAERYRLRFGCEDCAHFEASAGRCAEGFPCAEHLAVDLTTAERVVFCKSFELG